MKEGPKLLEDFHWLTAPVAGGMGQRAWLGLALAALVVAVMVWVVWNRWKKGRKVLPFLEPPRPHVAAMAALDELEARLAGMQIKEFVEQVSLIVRVYIHGRFGLRAPHRSTEEFLDEAALSRLLEPGHQELLAGFLARCDLVKFARHGMALDEMSGSLASARNFIQGTIPQAQAGVAGA